ncbi:MAG: hypothetical protein KF716_14095 [Anaerolineae bacterium]|nr:hypothetical protein [Anaerolineae bacterium]
MKFTLDAKRGGLIALVLVILVLGIEGTLTLLRKRDVSASIAVVSLRPTATLTPVGRALPSDATPDPATVGLIMTDDGSVVVNIMWAYNIGPRFPQTILRAVALDKESQVVASASQFVDCSGSTLDCNGNAVLTLRYGEMAPPDNATTHTPVPTASATLSTGHWPLGEYTVLVTRAYEGFSAVEVARDKIVVAAE